MAESMKQAGGWVTAQVAGRIAGMLLAVAGSLAPDAAHGADLPDPTRPPGAQETLGADGSADLAGPTLQSVLIGPHRKVATISGKQVRVGEKFGDAVLVRISENAIVLRTNGVNQTLKLFPDVEKSTSKMRKTGRAVKPRADAGGNKVKEQE
jgi:MSHA biogenesis protein MshK